MTQSVIPNSLYEQDFALWIDDTVARLKARNFDQIDLINLIEEIESLGRSDKRELESRLEVLLAHILKRVYVDRADDYRGWILTIAEQRRQLKRLLKASPSLKNYLNDIFAEIYQDALESVKLEYPEVNFPIDWPFNSDTNAILNETFWQD